MTMDMKNQKEGQRGQEFTYIQILHITLKSPSGEKNPYVSALELNIIPHIVRVKFLYSVYDRKLLSTAAWVWITQFTSNPWMCSIVSY